MANLFTYGSLMFDPVWQRVVRGRYPKRPALLNGFIRYGVQGETYPVILPSDEQAQVKGVLYLGINHSDMARLDTFEGEYYDRIQIRVLITGEQAATAEVYVLKPRYYHIATRQPWDASSFEREGLQRFIDHYVGFEAG